MRKLFLVFSGMIALGALHGVQPFSLMMRGYLLVGRMLYALRVHGAENMPTEEPCVIVVNHASPLGELFVFGTVLQIRGPNNVLMGAGGLPAGRSSRFLRKVGKGIAGTKGRGLSAGSLWKGLEVLADGKAVILAPEGELTWDGRLLPLTPGAAWMAMRAGVPVVPVISNGAYEVMPRWASWPRFTGKITIRVGKPLHLSDNGNSRVTNEMAHEASRRIWEQMSALSAPAEPPA